MSETDKDGAEPDPSQPAKEIVERATIKETVHARVRNRLFNDIPEAARGPFEGIWRAGVRVHFRWLLYKQLYGSQPKVDLLNEVGVMFFSELQQILQDDVVLALARLIDPKTGTMTLHHLLDCAENTRALKRVPDLRAELEKLERLGEPFTAHRHNRIAHASIEHHPSMVGLVLPGISVALIDDFLAKFRALTGDISSALEGGGAVNFPVSQNDDGNTLMWNLCKAVDYDELMPDAFDRQLRLAASKHGAAWTQRLPEE